MDPAEVVAVLVVGPVADVYRVTVIEGLRVGEILTRLSESCRAALRRLRGGSPLRRRLHVAASHARPADPRRLGRAALPGHLRVLA